ncbi:MAG: potassium channel protein, partial [Rhodocyclaceae bacterium]|nr:potassium channel protein [Rhodocyclaceae bacterium]
MIPGTHHGTLFLMLRRMRAPLILLIVIFAISVLGLTIVPGFDEHGNPARMSFFHAFYFISYTATTIGFGEVPNAFSEQQRMWATMCIYMSVVGWAYTIGTLFGLFQDKNFRHALRIERFARAVRRLQEPFFLVCGYGETGSRLIRALDRMGMRVVVVEVDEIKA